MRVKGEVESTGGNISTFLRCYFWMKEEKSVLLFFPCGFCDGNFLFIIRLTS